MFTEIPRRKFLEYAALLLPIGLGGCQNLNTPTPANQVPTDAAVFTPTSRAIPVEAGRQPTPDGMIMTIKTGYELAQVNISPIRIDYEGQVVDFTKREGFVMIGYDKKGLEIRLFKNIDYFTRLLFLLVIDERETVSPTTNLSTYAIRHFYTRLGINNMQELMTLRENEGTNWLFRVVSKNLAVDMIQPGESQDYATLRFLRDLDHRLTDTNQINNLGIYITNSIGPKASPPTPTAQAKG